MNRLLQPVILASVLAFASPLTAGARGAPLERPSAIVRTDSGAVQGVRAGSLDVFKGVPFAAPPVGEKRWRPPAPHPSWSGVRAAKSFAPACMQAGVSMPGEPAPRTSEDCLYLNVWGPSPAGGRSPRPLPVLVWIHGGGWTNGATSMPLYAGDVLARQGIVVVTIAYRLGALGFLAHAELSREGAGSSGNYGLQDQLAALRWVQRNIRGFGGDPRQVTIAGQSAGAMSVSLLIASPPARGLFRRAIAQSGGVFEPVQLAPDYLLSNAERRGQAYAQSLGAMSVQQLRALPAARLLGDDASALSHPVIEPRVLPRPPYDAYRERRHHDVPLLLGSNAEEGAGFVAPGSVKASTFEADVARRFGRLPPGMLAAYPAGNDEQAARSRVDLETDLRFGWNVWAWARLQAEVGHSPVFYYRFTHRPPFPADSPYAGWGASHFTELWYMFGALAREPWPWTRADHVLSETMLDYWAAFVRHGDPNHARRPPWPRFTSSRPERLRLGWPLEVESVGETERLTAIDDAYRALRR